MRQQLGADTILSDRHRLVLLDCFETLVQFQDAHYIPRQGMVPFLEELRRRRKTLAVISDAVEPAVIAALREAGLQSYFREIYHAGNAAEDRGLGRLRKRLDLPLQQLGFTRDEVVFIGDSPLDAEAAQHHRIPFIRVPRSEDATFSFLSLLKGPSRYDSGEFSSAMLQAYLRKP